MEDYILSINYFDQEKFCHLFCIFDGHNKNTTAKLYVNKFPKIFSNCLKENPDNY